MSATARLRSLQFACVLLILACIWVSRLGHHEWQGSLTLRHWIVIAAAIWTAISGFTVQRRIVNKLANPRRTSRSTSFTRWRAGHIVRLWTALSVGLCALALSEFSGPTTLVKAFIVLSLLLLLAWTPGTVPDQTA